MFCNFLILPTLVPLVKIEAPVPAGGITTFRSTPEPVKPAPRIPDIDSTSILATVYPLPGDVTTTSCI